MYQQPLFMIQLHLQKKQVSHFIFFYDYLQNAFALPQKRGVGWAELISM